jgi:hypothetical protein
MRGEMGGQGALSRTTFTRRENNDVHTLRLQIDPQITKNESAR